MIVDKAAVRRALVISLSNVGDIILTTPVIGLVSKEFRHARIDVMVGPAGKELFEKDPRIFKVIIYDKHLSISEKRRLQLKLSKLNYDLIVDLRNTIFPLLLGPRFRTGTIQRFPKGLTHAMKRHLHRLTSLGIDASTAPSYIHIPREDEKYVADILNENDVREPIVVISPGAKSHLKRWMPEGYSSLADRLIRDCSASVIFVGSSEDKEVVDVITGAMKEAPYNFVKKTNIRQLASLLKRAKLLITNDSAPLHLGCAVGTKVLAIFGPTDPDKYGPTGELDVAMAVKLSCAPCESATCSRNYECMKLIDPDEVFETARLMIEGYEE